MASKKGKRTSIFDYVSGIEADVSTNKYCKKDDLRNEASVESFFVLRMLQDLGYKDIQIKTKESIAALAVSGGGAQA